MDPPIPNTPPSRTGIRRLIPPWEFRHLRGWGSVRIAAAILLGGLGVVTLSFGGNDAKTYEWTGFWLLLAMLDFAFGYWEISIAAPR